MLYFLRMKLGEKIGKAIEARGTTQADLSRAIGCDPAALSAVIRRKSAKSALAAPIAAKLEIPVDWFLTDDDSPVPPLPGTREYPKAVESKPLTIQEQAMDFEKGAALLVEAWKALPENERVEVLQQVNVRSMKYRAHTPDQQLQNLAAPGTAASARGRRKIGTQ